ncbi:type IV secretory system conjugative DNA transfer family protein [Amycolatopsis sp. NPDC051128]|uniref:type IV secretory system conjugative DNA transfer family protein n=1 Tax=Amycolatopsis sp. NPDC051128 TaxID=3155412 RepID=UPI003416C258
MPEFRWFEAALPPTTSHADATAVVRALADRPHQGLRRLQPMVVFELWLRPDGVHWLVGAEPPMDRGLPGLLEAQLPGLVLTATKQPDRPRPTTAREVRFSSLAYPIRLDTATAVTAAFLAARRELQRGEAVCIQFVVGPSHYFNQVPVPYTPLDALGITTPRTPDSTARSAFRQKQSEPLLGVRGRIGAVAREPRWAGGLLRPVASALSLASGAHARLTASQQSSSTATQLFQIMGRRRTWSGILNASELAALIGWCIDGLDDPALPGNFAPPPASLLALKTTRAGRLLGASQHSSTYDVTVRLPWSGYAAHLHVVGPSGVGKSTLLANWALAEADVGRSVLVIEPKGDLVADVLARIPASRRDDVVVIDPGTNGPVVGINPLQGSRQDAERRAESLLQLFRELFGTAIGPRSADVLLHGLIAICRLEDGTLPDVPAFLTNPRFRLRVLAKVTDPLTLAPWAAWFDGISEAERAQVVAPVLNKLRAVVSRPSVRQLLAQPKPRFQLDDLFSSPKVVLINLNAGSIGKQTSELIGSLVFSQLWEAIQRQTTKPADGRREVAVIVDEWQQFTAGVDFADVLTRARGAKTSFTVAHQHLAQLSTDLKAAVLANARSRVVFRPAQGDAAALVQVLSDSVVAADLEQLAAFHAAARVLVDGAPSAAFEVATPPLPPPQANPAEVALASARRYGVAADELDAAVFARWDGRSDSADGPIGARRKRP